MLVDHTRERFFYHHQITDPLDLNTTEPSLFFTRLTAHFCAPVFVFLTGLSAWLYAHPPSKPKRSARSFLIKRGLFLILLEISLINFSWFGNYKVLYLQVIWAIGLSMIALGLMIKLPRKIIGLLGAVIILGHNLLSPVHFEPGSWQYPIWTIVHDRGYLLESSFLDIKLSYPVLPWIGVILVGYFSGVIYSSKTTLRNRFKWLLVTGITALIVLGLLRGFNIYGEVENWQAGPTLLNSIMSFLNYTKYPPSLDFILLTLGVGSLLLYFFERHERKWMLFLTIYGSVPMFFYVIHLYVLLIAYKTLVFIFGTNKGVYFGVDAVPYIWIIALIVAILLYGPTKKFSQFKRRSNSKFIKYF